MSDVVEHLPVMNALFRFPSASRRDDAVERWFECHSDGLGRIGVRWINLRRLGSIPKLPEVLIASAIGVVNELDLSGEEINLLCSGIEGSDRSRNNTDGGVSGI